MNIVKTLRKLTYYSRSLFEAKMPAPCDDAVLDVIIPLTAKDLAVFPLALEGIRRCVSHSVAGIYVVSPSDDRVKAFCQANGLHFVDETSVMGFGPRDMNLRVGRPEQNRSGWLFQQLVKLSGRVGQSPCFITVDADHVLLQPHTFMDSEHRFCFYQSKEYHYPYYDNMDRLLSLKPDSALSYVAHKMIFDRAVLSMLRADIESRYPGRTWYEAIMDSLDRNEVSGFSEFEMYGSYVPADRKRCVLFRNHHLPCGKLATVTYDDLQAAYGSRFRSVTFPDYLK